MLTTVLNTVGAPRDLHRKGGHVFTFTEVGAETPLPDDLITLTDGTTRQHGRVYAVDFGRQLVYIEPDN